MRRRLLPAAAGVAILDVPARSGAERAKEVDELAVSLAELKVSIGKIEVRLRALEDARDVPLRFERGDIA